MLQRLNFSFDASALRRKGVKIASNVILKTVLYVMLIGLAFVFLYPFIHMLVTSFKTYNDVMNTAIKWVPKEATVENWKLALEALNAKKTFFNSFIVTVLATIGHLLSCSLTAYGFARFNFPAKSTLFGIVIFSIIVPMQTISVPLYILFSNFKMLGTYMPMIIPCFLAMGLNGGLFIFLFRQYYIRLPKSLEEAAEIDGCTPYGTFFRIIMPSSGATTVVALVLSIVWHWNDYFQPGMYIDNTKNYMLPQMLPAMYESFRKLDVSTTQESIELAMKYHAGVVMAGTLICVIPLLIMFLLLQNKFMQGVERTGLVE